MTCDTQRNRISVRHLRRDVAGTSLLELSCALFLVTLGVFGALTLHAQAMSGTRGLHQTAVAFDALRNELETLRATNFDALKLGTAQAFRSDLALLERLVDGAGSVDIEATPLPDLVQVTARVAWTGDTGRRIEQRLTTRIARRGL